MARAESVVEQGWYPDPAGRYALRWYDGTAWTEHVVHESRRTTDPGGSPEDTHPPPGHDPRWLPPPSLPDGPRWGPFAIGVPSYGPDAVPEGGYEPVLTGNRALDLTQDYVNEFESQLRRDASLVRSSVADLRRTPSLKWLGTVLAVLVVVLFAALLGAVVVAGGTVFFGDEPTSGTGFLLVFVLVPLLALALAALYSTASVVSFSAAVAAGLSSVRGERPGAWGLVRRVLGAAGAVGALALARFAGWRPNAALKAGGALYEAFAVFVVPVAVDENLSVGAAQRRSEELVAARWGPGRFRALGLPQTSPWSVVYSSGVTRYGYKAPFLAAAAFIVILLGPLLIAAATGNTTAILVTFGWMWGSLVLAGLLWYAVWQPLLQGLLRAHLYHYAKTGQAREPYDGDALHACLREEMRARLGKPQRRPSAGPVPHPLGLGGVVRSLAADPRGYAQEESGITGADIKSVFADARALYRDGRLVTKAVRAAGPAGIDASSLVVATGLPPERCRIATINLLWGRKLRAEVAPNGETRFLPPI